MRRLIAPLLLLVASGCSHHAERPLPATQPASAATRPVSHPYPGVTLRYVETANPNEKVFAAIVDLRAASARVTTPRGGPDPDGDGPAATTLIPTSAIAERDKLDLALNGDYFKIVTPPKAPGAKDAEGAAAQQVFRAARPATVLGPAVTESIPWATPDKPRPALLIHTDGHLSIEAVTTPAPDVTGAIAGNVMLVEKGQPLYQDLPDTYFRSKAPEGSTEKVGGSNSIRHPRTAVGISKDGRKLIMVVVDGRSSVSAGMNWKQLAKTLADLGSDTALNLDGGGSSAFVFRDPITGKLTVLNTPSDGKERPVANALGVTVGNRPR